MRTLIQDAVQWQMLRARHIGASEVAALFGCGYQTQFEVWHVKKGDLPQAIVVDNERMLIGRHVEPSIASAAGEKFGYEFRKADSYYTDDECPGLGATPDYFLVRDGQEFPAEIKNASWGAFKDDWIIHDDGFTEPPLRFSLQCQVQMACTGANEALLVALISGDRLVRCPIPRHETAIAEIRRRVSEFWHSIDHNIEPPAEMPRDFEAAKRVWPGGHAAVDLHGDPDIEAWLTQLAELRDVRKRVEADADVIEAKVMRYCVDNNYAAITANGGRVSCKTMPAKPAHTREFKAQPERLQLRITTR